MPKLKTSKSASKRIINITKNNKIIRANASAQHRTKGKSKRTLLKSNSTTVILRADLRKIKKLVPYN